MNARLIKAELRGNKNFSHFGPQNNLFCGLEALFRDYARTGAGKQRKYLHDHDETAPYKQESGTLTGWQDAPAGRDLLFY